MCHTLGVEIHHIIPESEGGPDGEDNAAPLCPTCHEIYGANPVKRKLIRECRDLWYEICARRYASDEERLERIEEKLKIVVGRFVRDATDNGLLRTTVGQNLAAVYDPRAGQKVQDQDVEFVYEFFFGGTVGNDLFEENKRRLFERFGSETARRLCRYALVHLGGAFSTTGGFTECELGRIHSILMWLTIAFVDHVETSGAEICVTTQIDPNGELRLFAPDHTLQ
jgi:hypothetical protein